MARYPLSELVVNAYGIPKPRQLITITPVEGGSTSMWAAKEGTAVLPRVETNSKGVFKVWLTEGEYAVSDGAETRYIEANTYSRVQEGSGGGEETKQIPQLYHAPPAQSSPTTVTTGKGFYEAGKGAGKTREAFGENEDVIIEFPATETRESSMVIEGGRNIRVIGGAITNVHSGAAMDFKNVSGSVFIEGVAINMAAVNNDGIDVGGLSGKTPDVYIQNCSIENVNGTSGTVHADIFQPQAAIGRLYVDKLTGSSTYQGLFIRPAFAITSATITRTNLFYPDPGSGLHTYLLWLLSTESETPYPVTLSEVYIEPRTGQTVAANAVFPNSSGGTGGSETKIACYLNKEGNVTWRGPMQVAGVVIEGKPAENFGKEAGLGYVSPGYQSTAAGTVGLTAEQVTSTYIAKEAVTEPKLATAVTAKLVPTGGTTGQVLTKKSSTNNDEEWASPASGPPTGTAGGSLTGSYPNPAIGTGVVQTTMLEKEAVTGGSSSASKIAKETIQPYNVAALAIEASKIAEKAVTEAKLATAITEKLTAIKAGGTTGQVLTKSSSSNYATEWAQSAGSVEKALGKTETSTNQTVLLELGLANVFTAEVEQESGKEATFQISGAPAHPVEVTLIVKQGSGGKHKWKISGVSWVTSEPSWTEVAGELAIASLLVTESGAKIYGFAGAAGKEGTAGKEGKAGGLLVTEAQGLKGAPFPPSLASSEEKLATKIIKFALIEIAAGTKLTGAVVGLKAAGTSMTAVYSSLYTKTGTKLTTATLATNAAVLESGAEHLVEIPFFSSGTYEVTEAGAYYIAILPILTGTQPIIYRGQATGMAEALGSGYPLAGHQEGQSEMKSSVTITAQGAAIWIGAY